MNFEIINGITEINVNSVVTLAFAAILLLFGYFVKDKIKILDRYCIPAAIIGGFIFMFITWLGYSSNTFVFNFQNIFQDTFMLAFFTTVGLGASFELLKKGGKLLITYWIVAGVISIFQNIIGIAISKAIGLEAVYGLLASAISMAGGHGGALSYGNTFYDMGYEAAPLVGAAAATFGLVSAVLVGGPLGRRLIEKNNLKANIDEDIDTSIADVNVSTEDKLSPLDIIKNVSAIIICMALATIISDWISDIINMGFPAYVGAMFVAMMVRNINEKFHLYKFDFELVDEIGNVMLVLYLSLALMTLEIWKLSGLIGGVLVIVLFQLVLVVLLAYFVVFRILGKDYDAAVMCAGLCGHSLGATPSAIVNMTAINEKYGMSRKAMMIVPIVGAFLVDLIYHPQTIWFIRTFVEKLS